MQIISTILHQDFGHLHEISLKSDVGRPATIPSLGARWVWSPLHKRNEEQLEKR